MKVKEPITKAQAREAAIKALKHFKNGASLKSICEFSKINNPGDEAIIYFEMRNMAEGGVLEYGKKKEGRSKLFMLVNENAIQTLKTELSTTSAEDKSLEQMLKARKKIRLAKNDDINPKWVLTKTIRNTPIAIEQVWTYNNIPLQSLISNNEQLECELLVVPHYNRTDQNQKTTVRSTEVIMPQNIPVEHAELFSKIKFAS